MGEGSASAGSRNATVCSKVTCADCAEILHDLNNVLAGILLNAQVMEWKMPSYSRGKRYLHEIERSAQRGGEILKRLLRKLEAGEQSASNDGCRYVEASALTLIEGTNSPPRADPLKAAGLKLEANVEPATVILPDPEKVPHTMV